MDIKYYDSVYNLNDKDSDDSESSGIITYEKFVQIKKGQDKINDTEGVQSSFFYDKDAKDLN